MPRATAALTQRAGGGARRVRLHRGRATRQCAALASKAVSFSAAWISASANAMARLPTASSVYLDHHLVGAGLHGGVRAAEGDGATGLGLQGQSRGFQHVGQGQGVVHALRLAGRQWPENGRAACLQSRRFSVKSAPAGCSARRHSMAVLRLQRLGPRRARVREISMVWLPLNFGQIGFNVDVTSADSYLLIQQAGSRRS